MDLSWVCLIKLPLRHISLYSRNRRTVRAERGFTVKGGGVSVTLMLVSYNLFSMWGLHVLLMSLWVSPATPVTSHGPLPGSQGCLESLICPPGELVVCSCLPSGDHQHRFNNLLGS